MPCLFVKCILVRVSREAFIECKIIQTSVSQSICTFNTTLAASDGVHFRMMLSSRGMFTKYAPSEITDVQQESLCCWRYKPFGLESNMATGSRRKLHNNLHNCSLYQTLLFFNDPGSSVSTVSGYGLDDRANEFRFPAGANDFSSSLCVQTGSGAHPASCTRGTGDPFPGVKARPGRDANHSPPSSAEVESE
jgi:hypothetical protein